jgi:hypothetical protein
LLRVTADPAPSLAQDLVQLLHQVAGAERRDMIELIQVRELGTEMGGLLLSVRDPATEPACIVTIRDEPG